MRTAVTEGGGSVEATEASADEPSPHLTSRAEALRNVTARTEVVPGVDVVGGDGTHGDLGGRTLSNLLKVRPFVSFFCWLADRQFPASHRPETRVARLRGESPWFYWLCVLLDLVVSLAAVVILTAAATAVLYKTIWLTGAGGRPARP